MLPPSRTRVTAARAGLFLLLPLWRGLGSKKTGNLTSLSEEQLVDCDKKNEDLGCSGGEMSQGIEYVINAGKGLFECHIYQKLLLP